MKKSKWVIFILVLIFSACGANDRFRGTETEEQLDSGVMEKEAAPSPAGEEPAPVTESAIPQTRYRIKSADMKIEVGDLTGADKQIQNLVTESRGYISFSLLHQSSISLTCKIPADNFDNFINQIETIGMVKNKQITVEDVTSQFFDLETRIKNKRILLARYQSYLARANNTRELVELERTINNVTTEIESLEGSMKNLSSQISYSTLSLTAELPPGQGEVFSMPSLLGGLRGVGEFLLIFLYYLLIVLLYILVIGIPILLLVGGFYFVGFGRIGLLVKFFRALGPKTK
ncbi:MAG: DUF4349 domain-containing protein [Spirochaetales bacterium]|nr:DUF4349 domain-containing protein [Spirochaetales bacterium]